MTAALIILLIGALVALILVYYLPKGLRDSLANEQKLSEMQKKLNDKLALENIERRNAEAKLEYMNRTLEEQVKRRTFELEQKNFELHSASHDLHSAHEQIMVQERMASIGQLAAGIAHEIKNPLNFVNNFSDISSELLKELQEELKDDIMNFDENKKSTITDIIEALETNLAKVSEHGKRADNIIKNMLHHSRNEAGYENNVDVNALLKEYLNLAYHGMRAQNNTINVTIVESYDPNIGLVKIAPMSLGRVFLNMINNAIYASNEKKILIKNNEFKPTIYVKSLDAGNNFVIHIRDNGTGIAKEAVDKIYEPFYTTKPVGSGTGLGLSISWDIVTKQHHGTIEIDSKQGEYTDFILTIPKIAIETAEESENS